jgi:hypothetical protein
MSSATRGLYLPPAVLSLAGLSWPARLVLAEILDLYKVNGQEWANDQYFANRLPGTSMRAVQRAIQELEAAGHIHRETKQSAQHKRILTPLIQLAFANLARDAPDLSPNWREPIANLAIDLPPNLREPLANLADINYTINTKGNNTENPAANAVGARDLSESSTPSLKAKKELVPPLRSPPQNSGRDGPRLR